MGRGRLKRSGLVLRLQRALFQGFFWQLFSARLSAVQKQRCWFELEELTPLLRWSEIRAVSNAHYLELVKTCEKYVASLKKASTWKEGLNKFLAGLPVEGQQCFKRLAMAGANPYVVAWEIQTLLALAEGIKNPKARERRERNARFDKKIADKCEELAELLRRARSPGPVAQPQLARLSNELRQAATAINAMAKSHLKLTMKSLETNFCIALWNHLVQTTSTYHDKLLGQLLDTLLPKTNHKPRAATMMQNRRKRYAAEIERPKLVQQTLLGVLDWRRRQT